MVEEKVWCPTCEEERWALGAAGGYMCVVCRTHIPAEEVILAEQEEEENG